MSHFAQLPTPPAVPGSGAALPNPFPFACLVQVRGALTGLALGGAKAISQLASPVFLLAQGDSVTLTYAVAPAWDWYGLA